ncbi:MAG: hypothetical protein QNK37_25125 [Acidobacteriota bacterium]|nr:hypothetical protein [Acidobacteriota bacterium]
MSRWEEPVGYATQVLWVDQRLFLWDEADSKVKAYVFQGESSQPRLQWMSNSSGEGPREIPKSIQGNNLAFDRTTGKLWFSHQRGVVILDSGGNVVANHKLPFNEGQIAVRENVPYLTTIDRMNLQWFMVSGPIWDRKAPRWILPNLHDLPVNHEGNYIDPGTEITIGADSLFRYDANIGELTAVDLKGELAWHIRLPMKMPGLLTVEDYKTYRFGKSFTVVRLFQDTSGMVAAGDHLYILEKQHITELRTENGTVENIRDADSRDLIPFRLLTKIDQKTGEIIRRVGYPYMQHSVQLLAERGKSFLFFDMEEGNRIYRVADRQLIELR